MGATGSRSRSRILVLAEEFLAAAEARKYSPRTVEIYAQALRDFSAFLDGRGVRSAQEVTAAVVEGYRRHLQSRRFSPAGEETYCRAVKRLFDHLERRQRVFENPFAGSGPLRRARTFVPVPTEAEVAALLAVPDVATDRGLRTRAILEVAYSTGARLEEISRMKLVNLDLAAGTIRIMGKGSKERVVPLGREAAEWVKRYLAEVREKTAAAGVESLWVGAKGAALGSLEEAIEYVKEPQVLPGSTLGHAQARKLLEAVATDTPAGFRNRAMLELLYTSGIRAAEIIGLDVDHVDYRNGTARVTGKGQKERVVPVGRTALSLVESYLRGVRPFLAKGPEERALFLDEGGKRLPYYTLLRIVHAAAKRAGVAVNVTPHTFRRSCTTELLRGGAGMYHVKELLGHESLDTLQHYAKLTIHDLKKEHQRCHPRERDGEKDGCDRA